MVISSNELLKIALADYNHRYEAREIAWNTLNSALSSLRSFKMFCDGMHKEEDEVTEDLLISYRQWCLDKGNKLVTVNQKLIPLLLLLKKVSPEMEVNHLYYNLQPSRYGDQADSLYDEDDNSVRCLSARQLEDLIRLYQQLPQGWGKDCLDLFLFSFHACGIRISDIITLEWRHIDLENCVLRKVLVKTKKTLSIPLSTPAIEILSRWKDSYRNPRFVFDLLPYTFNIKDDAALSRAIDRRNHAVRLTLNKLARKLGYNHPVGMHMARHTFAVMALNEAEVNVHMISRLLGHSSVIVTEKVYAKYLMSTLSAKVRERLSFSDYSIK